MKIEMKTLQAGPDGTREAGKVYDVPDKEAKALIEGGYAVPYQGKAKAVVAEKAIGPRGRERAVAPNQESRKPSDKEAAADSDEDEAASKG